MLIQNWIRPGVKEPWAALNLRSVSIVFSRCQSVAVTPRGTGVRKLFSEKGLEQAVLAWGGWGKKRGAYSRLSALYCTTHHGLILYCKTLRLIRPPGSGEEVPHIYLDQPKYVGSLALCPRLGKRLNFRKFWCDFIHSDILFSIDLVRYFMKNSEACTSIVIRACYQSLYASSLL